MVRGVVKRGFEIFLLAYLFRLQEFTLSGFGGDPMNLFRIDILNCIGASMMAIAFIVAPRKGRPQIARGAGRGARWCWRWARSSGRCTSPTSSRGRSRRTWAASGRWPGSRCSPGRPGRWSASPSGTSGCARRASRSGARRWCSCSAESSGMALIYGVTLVRRINPYIIHYPSDRRAADGAGGVHLPPGHDRTDGDGRLAGLPPARRSLLGHAPVRAHVAAGLLDPRRPLLRHGVGAAARAAQHDLGDGRLRGDDRRSCWRSRSPRPSTRRSGGAAGPSWRRPRPSAQARQPRRPAPEGRRRGVRGRSTRPARADLPRGRGARRRRSAWSRTRPAPTRLSRRRPTCWRSARSRLPMLRGLRARAAQRPRERPASRRDHRARWRWSRRRPRNGPTGAAALAVPT